MKKVAVVVLLLVGVFSLFRSSPKAKAVAACENVAEVCGKSFGPTKSSDVQSCATQLSTDGPKQLGDRYDDTVSCMTKADSCGEVLGCMGGAMVDRLEGEIEGFARGFSRNKR